MLKRFEWWFKSSIVYGISALIGIVLMWYSDNWKGARISWVFAVASVVFLVVGIILYYQAKSAKKIKKR